MQKALLYFSRTLCIEDSPFGDCPLVSAKALTMAGVVEDDGIEPTTPCLQSRCSPS